MYLLTFTTNTDKTLEGTLVLRSNIKERCIIIKIPQLDCVYTAWCISLCPMVRWGEWVVFPHGVSKAGAGAILLCWNYEKGTSAWITMINIINSEEMTGVPGTMIMSNC